jgi:hypothetical protein
MTGAGIIVYVREGRPVNDPLVLIIKEGRYLTDVLQYRTVNIGGRMRNINGDLDTYNGSVDKRNDALLSFTNRAQGISNVLQRRVQFSQPVHNGTNWTTEYRYLSSDFKYGFIKGRREGTETPLENIQREFREETGADLPMDPRLYISIDNTTGYDWYMMEINNEKKEDILAKYANRMRGHYSEVFDLNFVPLSEVYIIYSRLNNKSAEVFDLVKSSLSAAPTSAGGRRRRRTNRKRTVRKNRKNRSRTVRR